MSTIPLRVLRSATQPSSPETPTLTLSSTTWQLFAIPPLPTPDIPAYTCISYAWGPATTPNPFDARHPMSTRALPALEAALRATTPAAIWLDAFCIPSEETARQDTLRNLGAIYAAAAEVVVVLSPACAAALEQADARGQLDEAALAALEADEWVSRAWTYQELANGKKVFFVAENDGRCRVSAEDMLNAIGMSESIYGKARGSGAFAKHHPRLDRLGSDLGSWMYDMQLERSAYQVLESMGHRRVGGKEVDRFEAMIGAIGAPADDQGDLHPAERFMRTCERKGDFSFLFTVSPREKADGKAWRPEAGPLEVVLPWYNWGESQPGRRESQHLRLDGMFLGKPGPIGPAAQVHLAAWLATWISVAQSGDRPASVLACLRAMGFTGCGEWLELEQGYFFPHAPMNLREGTTPIISTAVRWVAGAPGLLAVPDGSGTYGFAGIGVFAGEVPRQGQSILIGG